MWHNGADLNSLGSAAQGGIPVVQRKSGHVTLHDVAHACGFSVSTVSIVLSEAPLSQNVAASTRAQIRETARQLGYHPDAYARSLRRRRSQTIGVLAYDLSDPFCTPIVEGIQAGLQPADYLPLLMDAQTKRKLFDEYLRKSLERRAEGVIVIASWVFEETNLLADIEKNHVPIVILGRDLTGRKIDSLLVDNNIGGALAMQHLIDLGHRKIALIQGPEEMFDSAPRLAGMQAAAEKAGIRFDPALVFQLKSMVDPTSGFEGGRRFVSQMLASGHPFTAVVAFDDLTALGVIRGLAEAGLSVPQDCSVVGFDDVLPARVATPGITTVHQPLKQMGLEAAQWVLRAIDQRTQDGGSTVLLHTARPELVVRGSTARPAAVRKRKSTTHTS